LGNSNEKWNKTHKIKDGVDYKICNQCNEYLPSTNEYFYINKTNKTDGLYPYCIECAILKSKEWNKDNPEQYQKLKEKHNANRPMNQIMSTRLSSHRRRKSGKHKEWQRGNPDKIKLYNSMKHKHNITRDEWFACLDYFDWCCAYCNCSYKEHIIKVGEQLHKDHVNHDGHDYIDNCVPACKSCNTSKHNKEFANWYNKYNINFSESRLKKIIDWVETGWQEWTE